MSQTSEKKSQTSKEKSQICGKRAKTYKLVKKVTN